ncbi:fungal-specific transcription factor domain-containing protein [Aspergillus novoparasiticus]|uniref:Fungal-specific transcription factor domain-containing protein n=1 Tax=Aspergillus novoparasiticus TaxID=986946 RepID=A0A5N6EWM5_9EURO|nr:fungal-specific transcription factor domain-containing protein [Aspergillus novoparasiticus]
MSHGARENAVRFPRQKIRLPYPRSKSGCLVCRRQHKKCDERRPACSRCLSKGKVCQWPDTVRREPNPDRSRSFHHTRPPTPDFHVDANACGEEIFSPPSASDESAGSSDDGLHLIAPLSFSLDPVSSMFLAHFVAETSRWMTTVGPEKNPFLTHILPLAFSDELILHSLLAFGGAHLERKQSSPEIDACVCRHYGRVIHLLNAIISRKSSESDEWLRALLALLILYLIGVFSPLKDEGALMHIRAGKQVVCQLLSTSSKTSSSRTLCGLTFELYTYVALVASPTPYTNGTESELDTRTSLLPSWDIIRNYGIFGIIVSPIYQCLEVIPRVVALCTRRQAEMTFNECSAESWAEFESVIGMIETIEFADDVLAATLNPEDGPSLSVSAVYRHALTIFAYDAMWCGTLTGDERRLSIVREHALSALALIPTLMDTHFKNILLWPAIVAGSCLLKKEERDILRSLLSNGEPISVVMKMKAMLESLWAETDPLYFGPYGLQKHMRSHQTVIYLG